MQIRAYRPEDCTELAELFYHTVHTANAKDYTAQELEAWACGTVDLEAWNSSFLAHTTLVAEADGRLVGFGDMDASGYLDRLYIHADYQGQGIATAICDRLESAVTAERFCTQASVTARPVFEKRGYRVRRSQHVERRGVLLKNYLMEKTGKV